MYSHDQNLDDALAYQEESLTKGVQLVVSIVRADNWESTGIFIVKLGLEHIASISQAAYDLWCYTLFNECETETVAVTRVGFATRFEAAFAAISHCLKNSDQAKRGHDERPGGPPVHPEYHEQQKRLPSGCQLWGNYGDGKWRVRNSFGHGIKFAHDTPKEAVDGFLASNRIKE